MALTLAEKLKAAAQANLAEKAAANAAKIEDMEDKHNRKTAVADAPNFNLSTQPGNQPRTLTRQVDHLSDATSGTKTKEDQAGARAGSRAPACEPAQVDVQDHVQVNEFVHEKVHEQLHVHIPVHQVVHQVVHELPEGLGNRQRAILEFLLKIKYWKGTTKGLAEATQVPAGTTKNIIHQFDSKGWINTKGWRNGQRAGLIISTNEPAIFGMHEVMQLPVHQVVHDNKQLHVQLHEQVPIEKTSKIDRKDLNLSISLEDMNTHWTNLARSGFGPDQLAQIEGSLTRVGKSTERIVQSLDHAEWELEHGAMLDKQGQPVADPCAWVFRSLAQTGYYRRPKGYVSAEEQALRDEEEEAKAMSLAAKASAQARFQAWVDTRTPEQLEIALKGFPGGDRQAWLKRVWQEQDDRTTKL